MHRGPLQSALPFFKKVVGRTQTTAELALFRSVVVRSQTVNTRRKISRDRERTENTHHAPNADTRNMTRLDCGDPVCRCVVVVSVCPPDSWNLRCNSTHRTVEICIYSNCANYCAPCRPAPRLPCPLPLLLLPFTLLAF